MCDRNSVEFKVSLEYVVHTWVWTYISLLIDCVQVEYRNKNWFRNKFLTCGVWEYICVFGLCVGRVSESISAKQGAGIYKGYPTRTHFEVDEIFSSPQIPWKGTLNIKETYFDTLTWKKSILGYPLTALLLICVLYTHTCVTRLMCMCDMIQDSSSALTRVSTRMRDMWLTQHTSHTHVSLPWHITPTHIWVLYTHSLCNTTQMYVWYDSRLFIYTHTCIHTYMWHMTHITHS